MNKLNTTKKATLILAGALTLVSLGGLFSQFKGTQDTSGMEISSVQGINIIQIVKKTNENGAGTTTEVTYTITPADATELDFNYSIGWSGNSNATYETSDWKNGKKVSDYVTYVNDTSSKKLTFTCSQPFGNSIIFGMEAQSNNTIQATITLDYTRQITSAASLTGNFALTEGQTLNLVKTDPVVSIGTKGNKASDYSFTSYIDFPDDAAYPYENLFVDTDQEGEIHAISGYDHYSYNGFHYSSMDEVLNDMEQSVNSYFASFKDLTSSVQFKASELKKRLTVTYYLGNNYTDDAHVSTAFYYNFVSKYKEYTNNDQGFYFVAGNTSQKGNLVDELLTLNIDPKQMTEIAPSSTAITF